MRSATLFKGFIWALVMLGPAPAQDAPVASGVNSAPSGEALNKSVPTTCAEDDNVNIPLRARNIRRFQVQATHPNYNVGPDSCDPDFSGCNRSADLEAAESDSCFDHPENKLADDGTNAIWVCSEPGWWRPFKMKVVVGSKRRDVHRLVWIRKIADQASWPQFLVLYEDGNMRLKPHPPTGRMDVCFGSSVIVGPAALAARPYVDIRTVTVNPAMQSLDINYRDGGTATLTLSVTRARAIANVWVHYNTQLPFATFRSMWVMNGNSDVDRIRAAAGNLSILGNWARLSGPWWNFYRRTWSQHNTSAPDVWIRILE